MCVPGTAAAGSSPLAKSPTGLLITPVRQFLSVNAGGETKSALTVENLTGSTLRVSFSVEQFSVTDYVYNYTFSQPNNTWLQPSIPDVDLQPHQSVDIPFTITVPPRSAPGGYYYTLLASASLSTAGVTNTIQAADLIYFTVNGPLITVSHLEANSIDHLVFGRTIPFHLEPINTGNVYSFVYVSGQLHGLLVKPPETSTAHILMPGKVRALDGAISSPVLPGIYLVTYGYKTTAGWAIELSSWVIFIPPWFIAFVLAVLLILGKFLPKRRHTSVSD